MSRAFAAWGRFVHRRRWLVLAGSAVLLALSLAALLRGGTLVGANSVRGSLESQNAADLASTARTGQPSGGTTFLLLLGSRSLAVSDPAFQGALETAIAPLRDDPRVAGIDTPYSVPTPTRAAYVSRDGHQALVRVTLHDSTTVAQRYYNELRDEVRSDTLSIQATGTVPLNQAFNTTLESDLRRAEVISLPVTLLLLLVIFASAVAALMPLGVGLLTIVGGLGGTLLLSHAVDVSQYALNVVTLIGLGVSIDYSLFLVSRFREELARGASREEALATTLATAGRAITFSGLTVAIGLSALLFYQGTFMASMGAAGTVVVGVAVLYGLTFLPAVLAVAGPRIDWLRLPFARGATAGPGFWGRVASAVMRRPIAVLVPAVSLLLLAGSPFLGIRLANGDVDMLPPGVQARQAFDTLRADFPGADETTFTVVVDSGSGAPATDQQVAALSQRISHLPGVLRVTPTGIGPHVVVLTAFSNLDASSDPARDLLAKMRSEHVEGARVLVGGTTAYDVDIIHFVVSRTPLAVGFVIAVTLVVLFLLTGSVVLPIKAVLTNLASIAASFGALVWIFQQGHLSTLLDFTPQSIDPSIPVILFATVFGLSMDYEVLLVSRIQEERERTGDNTSAVASGLARSGRLITGAAAVMVVVFLAFGLAHVVEIKAIGFGLAIAVALDATIVRGLIVPSVMRLLGDANWWAPAPLRWLHRRAGIAEFPATHTRAA